MNEPFVSIVIPCRNEHDFIIPCINSVLNNDYPGEKIEIIVCDGLSNDGTYELLKNFAIENSKVNVLVNEKKTTQHALNLGIKSSKGGVVIILGAHAEMSRNYISKCVDILNSKPEVMCCGGILKNIGKDKASQIISLALTSPFGVGNAHFRTGRKDGYVDTVAFGAYRREIFSLIGLFNADLARNQDDEFNYRLCKAGGKIWLVSDTSVNYYVRSSLKKIRKQYFHDGYWKVYVNSKHRVVTTLRQLIPFLFVLFLISGLFISMVSSCFFIFYVSILVIYLILAFIFAAKLTINIDRILRIILTFFIIHISYGTGYLKGVIDFFILNKKLISPVEVSR
jgi:glycosyltransferase involved in cell wall biosynthesis